MGENSQLPQDEKGKLAAWLNDETPRRSEGGPDTVLSALDALWTEGPPEAALEAMREGLDDWWAEQRLVVYYDSLPTPIGAVYAAVTDKGVISVDFGLADEAAYLEHLSVLHFSNREAVIVRAPERVESVTRQLGEYFRGEREGFDFPVDLRGLTDFQREVLKATSEVLPGEIVSYKEIARRIGRPKAVRAVGNALGRNPVPILIPCHRVVPTNGTLGGYSGGGGSKTKARLLALEGVLPGERGLYAPA